MILPKKTIAYISNGYDFTGCCGAGVSSEDTTCLKCDKKIERVYSKADRKEFACKIWYNTLRNQFLVDTQINGKGE